MRTNESTRQKMFALIEQWEQSNLAQQLFCEQNNVNYKTFLYWRKQYCNKNKSRASAHAAFIPLQLQPTSGNCYAELVFTNGCRLLFHHQVSSDYLKTLIS